jgi:serine/threonine protein kinase
MKRKPVDEKQDEEEVSCDVVFENRRALKRVRTCPRLADIDTSAVREAAVLRRLADCADFVVPLQGLRVEPACMTLELEQFQHDLNTALFEAGGRFPEGFVVQVLARVLSALVCAQQRGIVHNDVKLSNILLDGFDGSSARLADWGIAAFRSTSTVAEHKYVQTAPYRAPENLLQCTRKYDSSVADCWSCGQVGLELLGVLQPSAEGNVAKLVRTHIKRYGFWMSDADRSYWTAKLAKVCPRTKFNLARAPSLDFPASELGNLLRGLLQVNPTKRLTAAQALSHPVFLNKLRPLPVLRGRNPLRAENKAPELVRGVAVRALEVYTDNPREFFLGVALLDFAWHRRNPQLLRMGGFVAAVINLTRKLLGSNNWKLPPSTDKVERLEEEREILRTCDGDLWFTTAVDVWPQAASHSVELYSAALACRNPAAWQGADASAEQAAQIRSLILESCDL